MFYFIFVTKKIHQKITSVLYKYFIQSCAKYQPGSTKGIQHDPQWGSTRIHNGDPPPGSTQIDHDPQCDAIGSNTRSNNDLLCTALYKILIQDGGHFLVNCQT